MRIFRYEIKMPAADPVAVQNMGPFVEDYVRKCFKSFGSAGWLTRFIEIRAEGVYDLNDIRYKIKPKMMQIPNKDGVLEWWMWVPWYQGRLLVTQYKGSEIDPIVSTDAIQNKLDSAKD